MANYKWNSPQEWLLDKVQCLATANDTAAILSLVTSVVNLLDADQVQRLRWILMDSSLRSSPHVKHYQS
jgi:hypothetical protein